MVEMQVHLASLQTVEFPSVPHDVCTHTPLEDRQFTFAFELLIFLAEDWIACRVSERLTQRLNEEKSFVDLFVFFVR